MLNSGSTLSCQILFHFFLRFDKQLCLAVVALSNYNLQSTDYLLVKVQDAIAELSGLENDETIAKEVEAGKEAIKDADQMKQVTFALSCFLIVFILSNTYAILSFWEYLCGSVKAYLT